MSVARLRLHAFFRPRLDPRAAAIATRTEEKVGGSRTVSPFTPFLAHA